MSIVLLQNFRKDGIGTKKDRIVQKRTKTTPWRSQEMTSSPRHPSDPLLHNLPTGKIGLVHPNETGDGYRWWRALVDKVHSRAQVYLLHWLHLALAMIGTGDRKNEKRRWGGRVLGTMPWDRLWIILHMPKYRLFVYTSKFQRVSTYNFWSEATLYISRPSCESGGWWP